MIITRGYAKRLVRFGDATEDGATNHDNRLYQIVVRHDIQRIDHYQIDDVDQIIDQEELSTASCHNQGG